MKTALLLVAIAILTGCSANGQNSSEVPAEKQKPVEYPTEPFTITFATEVCYGTCPAFTLTIDNQGYGTFEGREWVSFEGKTEFRAKPAQLDAFLERIAPFRPEGRKRYGYDSCGGGLWTDLPEVKVQWDDATGTDEIDWYLGCEEPALIAIRPNLYEAWQELPIDHLVQREPATVIDDPEA